MSSFWFLVVMAICCIAGAIEARFSRKPGRGLAYATLLLFVAYLMFMEAMG